MYVQLRLTKLKTMVIYTSGMLYHFVLLLLSPAVSLGFTIFGEVFAYVTIS